MLVTSVAYSRLGPEFANLWRFRGMAESLCAGVNRRVTAPPQALIN